jgi:hypothetical protein
MSKPKPLEPFIQTTVRMNAAQKALIYAAVPPGMTINTWMVQALLDAADAPPRTIPLGQLERLVDRSASLFAARVARTLGLPGGGRYGS